MFKDDYRKELDNISASEKFKQDTISLMNEKQAELQQNEAKTIKFRPKYYGRIAASVAVLVLALGAYAYSQSDFAIGPDNAGAEKAVADQSADQEIYDSYNPAASLLNSNDIKMRVYTVKDAQAITSNDHTAKEKISVSVESGGMGYEAVMYYDISEMATDNPFDESDSFDMLTVYQFNKCGYEQAYSELQSVLDKLGRTTEDITAVECSWSGTPDTHMGNITTYDFSPPHKDAVFQLMKVSLGNDVITIFTDGIVDADLYTDIPDYSSNDEYLNYIQNNYSDFIGENIRTYNYNDYTYSGQQLCTNHFYSASDDYSDNLLNYSVFDIVFNHIDDYVYYTEEKEEGIAFTYLMNSTYSPAVQLPAISYTQALGLLYEGNYQTSVPYEIHNDSVVVKIELVYKEPPRNYQTMVKEGCALPFYKFYVQLPDETATENGVLKHYGVYYVCAIHPDYVEYTDGYINFN
ncbi:MAG: hypothetical protein IJ362_04705 [Oscillospiraceae bacterium]|nr:hypothetical protein [Oscillospiraceae bacterium]